MEFYQKDIISVRNLNRDGFETIFDTTERIMDMDPAKRREVARGKILGYLFLEPSTRTRLSFQSAMALLGGTSLGISNVASSSAKKGESLSDMVRMMSIYSDVLVMRHPLDGSSKFVCKNVSSKPVINGCLTEEHPTQIMSF